MGGVFWEPLEKVVLAAEKGHHRGMGRDSASHFTALLPAGVVPGRCRQLMGSPPPAANMPGTMERTHVLNDVTGDE